MRKRGNVSAEVKNKIYIRTFGCQMNDYDSERMYRLMERSGWESVSSPNPIPARRRLIPEFFPASQMALPLDIG